MITTRRIAAGTLTALLLTATPAPAANAAPPQPAGPDRAPNVSVAPDRNADPILEGTPRKPSRDVGKTKKRQQQIQAAETASLPTYNRDEYQPKPISEGALPSRGTPAPVEDPGLHDAQGVRMFSFNGQLWDHPVGQAQWGLQNVTAYVDTGNPLFLNRAKANAQRNIDRKVVSRDAWFYPYDFDLSRCTGRPILNAPWYSGMSQGQLLSLFVRLHEITGEMKWREAADMTFASLAMGPDPVGPWASWVDSAGYLWLEEYPDSPGIAGERVMNGHIFAIYGVYDYWRITNSTDVAAILDGAITTVRQYMPDPIRNPRWASNYSIGCNDPHLKYHVVHTEQSLKLYEMTHVSLHATNAYLLRSDYPSPPVSGTVRFSAGTHVGYTFNSSGAITGSKSLTLGATSIANANQRIRVIGRNYYYRITNGAFAGYLVPETFGARELLGKVQEQKYSPNLMLNVAPGTYTGYAYDSAGNITGSKTITFPAASGAPLGATAWVNGRLSYQPTAGSYVGYWLPHVTGLSFS
ncbi:D-glucuronyl C5-epimerase family protein [Micromonospora echinospora]|uniref:D-glucuronyl C5-epimerase family protein n=1 Tax=Micromonospora echinospora TaxID=1877 RepID=UPI00379C8081